jgi:hypothetical protein
MYQYQLDPATQRLAEYVQRWLSHNQWAYQPWWAGTYQQLPTSEAIARQFLEDPAFCKLCSALNSPFEPAIEKAVETAFGFGLVQQVGVSIVVEALKAACDQRRSDEQRGRILVGLGVAALVLILAISSK